MDDHMCIKGSAFATCQNYIRGVKLLICHHQKVPEDCTLEEVSSFLSYQKEVMQISSSTLNIRVCSLKYYYRHVVNRLDLVVRIPNPRLAKFDTEMLNEREVQQLFDACRDIRQLLILQLLYDCGLRIGEVKLLRIEDFNKSDRTIRIRKAKGNRTRTVYYGDRLRKTLIQYAKLHGLHQTILIDSYTEPDKALSLSGIQHIVKEIVRRSGINKRASSHTLRHTHAVHYLNRGGSIFSLQLLLGHKQISTTLDYLKHANLPDGIRISILDILPT